jgi:uncharacterized protein with PQ loop repeat
MAQISVATLAGIASTVIFAWSVLPMLAKAYQTRNLASYSLGNLVLANVGNAVHSVYVFSLPLGPIWALHGFYLATSGLMLVWWLRYGRVPRSGITMSFRSRHEKRFMPTSLERATTSPNQTKRAAPDSFTAR